MRTLAPHRPGTWLRSPDCKVLAKVVDRAGDDLKCEDAVDVEVEGKDGKTELVPRLFTLRPSEAAQWVEVTPESEAA